MTYTKKQLVKEGPFAGLWCRTAKALVEAGYTDRSQLLGVLVDELHLLRSPAPKLRDFGKKANQEVILWLKKILVQHYPR